MWPPAAGGPRRGAAGRVARRRRPVLSLQVLAAACRAEGDLDEAGEVASRYLAAAGRVGGHDRPYYAVQTAADIALDRGI